MQILVYTSDFSVFINYLSKIMIQSNAKSFLDNTAMLYNEQHHQGMMCVWIKGDLSAKSMKIVAKFCLYRGKNQILSSLLS